MKILTFDTETTGVVEGNLDYIKDNDKFPRVVSLGWVYEVDGKVLASDYRVIRQSQPIPSASIKIHGITDSIALSEGVEPECPLPRLLEVAENADLIVGHNLNFDILVIKAMFVKYLGEATFESRVVPAFAKKKRICTMWNTVKFVGAKTEKGRSKLPTLEDLYFKLFNETFEAHNAFNDVLATQRCFDKLVKLGVLKAEQNPKYMDKK